MGYRPYFTMSILLEQPTEIKRMLVTTPEQARAIEDPVRARILELLYHKNMTVDKITEALRKAGHDRAVTTVRHHVRILQDAGLIQITRIDEVRGTVSKRYGTQTRLLSHEMPEDFDARYAKIIGITEKRMERVLQTIHTNLKVPNNDKLPESYYHHLAVEIVNRAMTSSLEPRD